MDYGKEIKKIIADGDEEEFYEILGEREEKSQKIREKAIAPYIGDAFLEVGAGNVKGGGDMVELGFNGDEGLTKKLFDSALRELRS